jgi:hypothetical protein
MSENIPAEIKAALGPTALSKELTAKKAATVLRTQGGQITGFVVTTGRGEIAIVDKSAVRWLGLAEFWQLMHPKQ